MNQELEQSRTEQATPYKLEQARKKGSVARSIEASTLGVMTALAGYLWAFGADTSAQLQKAAAGALAQAPALAFGPLELWSWSAAIATRMAASILPLMLLVVVVATLVILVQIGFVFSIEALKPDASRLNPANGFKRIFSAQTIYESVKSVLKLAVYGALAVLIVHASALHSTDIAAEPRALAALLGTQSLKLVFWLLAAMTLFAAADIVFTRRRFASQMMMSRRELREETRHREGDSRIKQRRRQLAQELLKRSRSMRQLRSADVLITNPTHYAVALRYDSNTMLAPQVVSRGSGEFALRLRRLAFIYGIPVVEDRQLARTLFFKLALDSAIPESLFHQTAAVYLRLQALRQARMSAPSPVLVA
jgi:flagellar biosynthetic protein FlhB